MFILGIIVNVVNNLHPLKYGHNLAVYHVVDDVDNHVSLLMKLLLLIVRVDDYVLLNKLEKSKDHVDPLQVRNNKCAGSSNHTLDGIGCLEG